MFSHQVSPDLTLTLLQTQHADALFDLTDQNREYLRQYLPWVDKTQTVEDSKQYIDDQRQRWADEVGCALGIWYQQQLTGVIGLNSLDLPNARAEIGYWLAQSTQGRGIMTLSSQALITYCFQELGVNRIEIRVATNNPRSKNIPTRLGFICEGTLRQAAHLNGAYCDLMVFSLLAAEWKSPSI